MPATYNTTINPSSDVTLPDGSTVSWISGDYIDILWMNDPTSGDVSTMNTTLSGNNWTVDAIRFSSNTEFTNISDAGGAAGRSISWLRLGQNSDVDLISTRIKHIEAADGKKHDVTLGSASTNSVTLYADVNKITTGTGFVGQIETGGKDTIRVNGDVGRIQAGSRNDTVKVFQGNVDFLDIGSGQDLLEISGDGRVKFVEANMGTNTFNLSDNARIFFMDSFGGDNVINISGSARLEDAKLGGPGTTNSISLSDDGRVDHLSLNNGTNTVNLTGNSRISILDLSESSNTVTTGSRFLQTITSWESANILNIGDGGAGQIYMSADSALMQTITASGFVSQIQINDMQATKLTLGDQGAGTVRLSHAGDMVDTGTGWVEFMATRDGDDVVNLGSGGAGLVRLGNGNDTLRLSEMSADGGVSVSGSSGRDLLDFSAFGSGVEFALNANGAWQDVAATGGAPGLGYVQETGIEDVKGTAKADKLTGDSGANQLQGLSGSDRLEGLSGSDTLIGGNGRDTLIGGSGADLLRGGAQNDVLKGGWGSDTLVGGTGNDRQLGGAGADVFRFGSGSGDDTVVGFEADLDKFEISDHVGGFAALGFSDAGQDRVITHDGGTIRLEDEAGLVLSESDFMFS